MREWFARHVDKRDVLATLGLAMLAYGGEVLYPGAGITAAGAVVVAIAVYGVR